MAGVYTVDASVFVTAFNPAEPDHPDAAALLNRLREAGATMALPTLVLPEVAGAIARALGQEQLARAFAGEIANLSGVVLVPVDARLAEQAAEVAARHRLTGADAVYVAVALRFSASLVTRDREQRQRVSGLLPAHFPAEALRAMQATAD